MDVDSCLYLQLQKFGLHLMDIGKNLAGITIILYPS